MVLDEMGKCGPRGAHTSDREARGVRGRLVDIGPTRALALAQVRKSNVPCRHPEYVLQTNICTSQRRRTSPRAWVEQLQALALLLLSPALRLTPQLPGREDREDEVDRLTG